MSGTGTTRICRHDEDQFVTADDGTSYCPACEDTARHDDPGGYDPRPDPRTHPDFWTE